MHTTIAKGNGTPVIVRVPQNDFTATKKVLEMGVDGIIFPMVKTAKEVCDLIDFSLYPPDGNRGFGPMAAINYGLADANEYVKTVNKDICRFIQIECKEIIDDLDVIMKNEYIDGYIFGPNEIARDKNYPIPSILKINDDKEIVIAYPSIMGIDGEDLYNDAERFMEKVDLKKYIKVKKWIQFTWII